MAFLPGVFLSHLENLLHKLRLDSIGFPPSSVVVSTPVSQDRPNFVCFKFCFKLFGPDPNSDSISNSAQIPIPLILGLSLIQFQFCHPLPTTPVFYQLFMVGPDSFSPVSAKLVSQIMVSKFVELNKLLSYNLIYWSQVTTPI